MNRRLSYLSGKEIKKAYHSKVKELFPDDLNAHDNFQRLETSYEIFTKYRQMMCDLEERERAAFASDSRGKSSMQRESSTGWWFGEVEDVVIRTSANISILCYSFI
ncbi:hypothetical protein AG4045_001585 [Apium graveolens]|uniref:J domain-containing protein n=1 Tax=Apium graveolens TaxID=4045 RepID=A0A6L5B9E2_APIGR|nr:hypothetical protein AG4045_001585 [Apium graveolens]